MKSVRRMSSWGAVGLAIGLAGSGGAARAQAYAPAAPPVTAGAQPAVTDASVTADIHAKLEQNKLLRNAQVTIATKEGVVTISGTVPSDFARDQVMETVRSTPGVVRVDDQLRLDISSPSAPTRN
jgi:hyperosmotically inducible periplasmic protein